MLLIQCSGPWGLGEQEFHKRKSKGDQALKLPTGQI